MRDEFNAAEGTLPLSRISVLIASNGVCACTCVFPVCSARIYDRECNFDSAKRLLHEKNTALTSVAATVLATQEAALDNPFYSLLPMVRTWSKRSVADERTEHITCSTARIQRED